MALDKQTVPISFGKGIDTKTDPKQVIPGKMISLQNAVFQTTNSFRKRNGYGVIPMGLSAGNAIASYNNELIAMDGSNLYSYSANQGSANSKGVKASVGLSVSSIVRTSTQQTLCDSSYHSAAGLYCYVWNDSLATGAQYSIIDSVTGQSIVTRQTISANAYNPKTVVIANFLVIFYFNSSSNKLCYKYINIATPTVLSSEVALNTSTATNKSFDIMVSNGALYAVYATSNSTITAQYFSSSGNTPPALVTTVTQAGFHALITNGIFTDASHNVWIATVDLNADNQHQDIKAMVYAPLLASQILAPTEVEQLALNVPEYPNQRRVSATTITGIVSGTTATILYGITNTYLIDGSTKPYFNLTRYNTMTLSGTAGTPADFLRSVTLASKAFFVGSLGYILVNFTSNEQPTYFLVDINKNIVAKLAPGNAGNYYVAAAGIDPSITANFGVLPEVNLVSSNNYQIAYLQRDRVSVLQGVVFTQSGVSAAFFNFAQPLTTVLEGENLNISGGIISSYDGSSVVEQNFSLFPENVSLFNNYSGGGLGRGSYQYSVVYEWTDSQGNIQKSAPSTPVTFDNSTTTIPRSGSSDNPSASIDLQGAVASSKIALGFGVSSSSAGLIPINDYLLANYPTSVGGSEAFLLASAPTSTVGSTNFSLTPELYLKGNTNAGQTSISIPDVNTGRFYCSGDVYYTASGASGTGHIVLPNPNCAYAFLKAMFVQFAEIQLTVFVTTVSGTTVNFVFNNLSVGLSDGTYSAAGQTIIASSQVIGTITAGSPTITAASILTDGSTSATLAQGLILGQPIALDNSFSGVTPNFPPGTVIIAIGANTITMSANANNNGSGGLYFGSFNAYRLMKGQNISSIDGITVPAGVVDSVTPAITTSYPITPPVLNLTLDSEVTATATGVLMLTTEVSTSALMIPTLGLTNKGTPVSIAVYRTIANGTTFYRLTSITAPLLNDKTVDYLYYLDGAPDSQIQGNEILYTTGGEVDNNAPPASNLFTSYKNRVILVSSEDPLTWWYSKQAQTGVPVEFSEFFVSRVTELDGPITAVSQLDDKLIFFKKNSIYYVAGDGPAPNGTNDDFTEAQLITSDTGCINAKSLVTIPNGIMYQSTKGIYLLERSLQVTYIGAEVEAYNTQTITSAKLVEGVNQVRFTLASGVILVYDYYFSQWSVFANLTAADATIFQDLYTFINPNGTVYQETIGSFNDNGAFIPIGLTMSWLSFAGLQGYERAYKVLLLGDYESPHTLTATINYDFATLNTQTISIPVTSPPTGPYQYRLFLQQQKCETFQVSLLESQAGPTYGEGLRLSAISVEVGIKKGLRKMPAAGSYG